MNKINYIELMERVLDAYTKERIINSISSVKRDGLSEHGFPRLTANIGILIAHGKRLEYTDMFLEMMKLCCDEIPIAKATHGFMTGNDFSVKEIVFCILELEKAEVFDKSVTDAWRKKLSEIDVYETYSLIAPTPIVEPAMNWAAFGFASEQLRKYSGIGADEEFMENQVKSQMLAFDENGMYKDPGMPMLYDLVPRLQLATALYFGYDGSCKDELTKMLIKSADATLKMQSVTGEVAYGGRSQQFLHNEALYAALCEFYAKLFKDLGDMDRAGQFKRSAHLAFDAVKSYLKGNDLTHIKNAYPIESMYGCEVYAYFDKYMVTAASWLYLAYAMADDSIEETNAPADNMNYVYMPAPHFHKVFVKHGDWTAEFDTDADTHYDASGLGRIHKRNMPSALCLSSPFTTTPEFTLDIKNPSHFSICGGIESNEGFVYGYDEDAKYTLIHNETNEKFSKVSLECTVGDASFVQTLTIYDDFAEVSISGLGNVKLLFPVFDTDGKAKTNITETANSVCVSYNGCKCTYTSENGTIQNLNTTYANRNGHYNAYAINAVNEAKLKITMQEE